MKEINVNTIIKDDNPIMREKSADVQLPLSQEDRELLASLYTYVDESTDPELAQEKGAKAITLGKRILRTETAGLCILSVLMFNAE